MHHVKALLFLVYGWLSKITCQMGQVPFGLDSLFGGFGAFPPSQQVGPPIGIENLFGQAQYPPSSFGMVPNPGMFSMGSLPFPLFPMPCDVICEHGGLFLLNISVSNQPQRPAGLPGTMPGAGAGAMPGGGGMPTTTRPPGGGMQPGGAMPPGGATRPPTGAASLPGGAAATRPPTGAGSLPGGAGATRPPTAGGAGALTTMSTRPPSGGGVTGGAAAGAAQQTPNINAQVMFLNPNWCTGWCRFFYRPRPMMPPPPPPPPPFPHPACLLFSWLGL